MGNDSALQNLRENLRGALIQAGDDGYDEARAVYNGMIDKRPALIARCADVADVMTAVNYARETGTLLAIRGGGHNGGGLGTCDDGLVIDLSRMNWVRVDPAAGTVRAGGGCTWGDVDHAAHAFGLAVPAGVISTTGVGGLTLGGGLGHLTRRCGLTIDNLLGADMVLADGSFATVGPEENTDLYWAIRGGGGNFGVVTSFHFRAHPIHTVSAGPMFWDIDQAPEVMRFYRDYITRAPEEINGFFALLTVPGPPFPEELHGRKVCGIIWCCACPEERAEKALQQARSAAAPIFEHVAPMPVPAVNSMFDALYPPGHQWYWRADFVNELSDEAIALHHQHGERLPTPQSTMHLYPINGAPHRVGPNDTPWAYRDANWAEVIVGVDPDPANAGKISQWTRAYWEALHPHCAEGAYVNFMMDEGQERVRATYRGNYDRLAGIKKRYDPDNLFRVNQNIKPRG